MSILYKKEIRNITDSGGGINNKKKKSNWNVRDRWANMQKAILKISFKTFLKRK